jgi:hypothetical protein
LCINFDFGWAIPTKFSVFHYFINYGLNTCFLSCMTKIKKIDYMVNKTAKIILRKLWESLQIADKGLKFLLFVLIII